MSTLPIDLVVYHANCFDGFAAHIAAKLVLGTLNTDYRPMHYGDSPEALYNYNHVCMVDFSLPRDQLLELATRVDKVTILDHHASAQKNLVNLPENIELVFNMEQSGCVIAWEYFHSTPVPKLFRYIEDRDLWRFDLPKTKAVIEGLAQYPQTFNAYMCLIDKNTDSSEIANLIKVGAPIVRYKQNLVEAYEKNWTKNKTYFEFNDTNVPYLNCSTPHLISDLGDHMDAKHGICIMWFHDGKNFIHSVRSHDSSPLKAIEIAEYFGGGGHKDAAGFKLDDLLV